MPQVIETKEQILDCAERLFGEQGIAGVSLRKLTRAAGVNLASVHYHFGSKEAVVIAAFTRRVRALNQERMILLDELEARADHSPPDVKDVLHALLIPILRLARDPERGQRFMQLFSRIYSEPADYIEPFFEKEFGYIIERFEKAFGKALPALPSKELKWRMHCAIGVMVHTMLHNSRIQKWTEGEFDPSDEKGALESLVRFIEAGMCAPMPDNLDPAEPLATYHELKI